MMGLANGRGAVMRRHPESVATGINNDVEFLARTEAPVLSNLDLGKILEVVVVLDRNRDEILWTCCEGGRMMVPTHDGRIVKMNVDDRHVKS